MTDLCHPFWQGCLRVATSKDLGGCFSGTCAACLGRRASSASTATASQAGPQAPRYGQMRVAPKAWRWITILFVLRVTVNALLCLAVLLVILCHSSSGVLHTGWQSSGGPLQQNEGRVMSPIPCHGVHSRHGLLKEIKTCFGMWCCFGHPCGALWCFPSSA